MKHIAIVLLAITLSGCGLFSKKLEIKADPIEVAVPLLYCPAPPDSDRPLLEIHELTDAQIASDGELVKAYAASIVQLQGHIAELEETLKNYDEINKAYEELRAKFEAGLISSEEIRNTGVEQ